MTETLTGGVVFRTPTFKIACRQIAYKLYEEAIKSETRTGSYSVHFLLNGRTRLTKKIRRQRVVRTINSQIERIAILQPSEFVLAFLDMPAGSKQKNWTTSVLTLILKGHV